ncbi:MAG: hypothetical protein ABI175_30215 [Polyangiales bacterium]
MLRIAVLAAAVIACSHPPAPPPPAGEATLSPALTGYMQAHGWGGMHLAWHTQRRWDRLSPAAVAYAERQVWRRAARQEGDAGNGIEFLAMHRGMMQMLVEQDASVKPLFATWASPPTDGTFDPQMSAALDRLEHHLDSFASEDALGLYIETSFLATDPTAGVHNYLHKRFQDPSSPIDLGNPSVNLMNPRFWALHGWIDRLWTRYRAQAGLHDTDPAFQATMRDAMTAMMTTKAMTREPPPADLIDAVRP